MGAVAIMTKAACVGSCKGMNAMKSCLHILFLWGMAKYLCIFVDQYYGLVSKTIDKKLVGFAKKGEFFN